MSRDRWNCHIWAKVLKKFMFLIFLLPELVSNIDYCTLKESVNKELSIVINNNGICWCQYFLMMTSDRPPFWLILANFEAFSNRGCLKCIEMRYAMPSKHFEPLIINFWWKNIVRKSDVIKICHFIPKKLSKSNFMHHIWIENE